MYAAFVLLPLVLTVQYSTLRWNGIGAVRPSSASTTTSRTLTDPDLIGVIANAFKLIIFFSGVPVVLGLLVASLIRRVATGALGTTSRTVLFLPQVIPLVAAGIMWTWLLSKNGLVNQVLTAIGLGGLTRTWLADFGLALPAVGVIGAWVLLGLCTILLLTGMSKIDQALYESARIDGASAWQEFRSITVPSLRYEIGVCITITVIASLVRVRHRLHLDAAAVPARPRRCPAWRSTASRSTVDRSGSRQRSRSSWSCSCSSRSCPSSG